jgi:hypothetical protein
MAGNKYYFITINERNGEQEYIQYHICQLSSRKAIDKYVDNLLKMWYDSNTLEFEDGGYYHLGGSIHVSVSCWREITEIEYQLLKRFI